MREAKLTNSWREEQAEAFFNMGQIYSVYHDI